MKEERNLTGGKKRVLNKLLEPLGMKMSHTDILCTP
jgi:hypothetical protein